MDVKDASDVLKGKFAVDRKFLSKDAEATLGYLFKSQSQEKRQNLSTLSKRTRVVEDIRDYTEEELIDYYCWCGGRSPTLGIKIPLRWLAVDKIPDNGRYSVKSCIFSTKWENNGAGCKGNEYFDKEGINRERVRLGIIYLCLIPKNWHIGMEDVSDDRLIKVAALQEYYGSIISFLKTPEDLRDYS